MFDVIGQLSQIIKKGSGVSIDNNVFTLHYRLTVILLVLFSVIVGSRKYFGDPIDCSAQKDITDRIADNYCWFKSYIIVPRDLEAPFEDNYHPVINNKFTELAQLKNDSRYKAKFLHAYQWVEFVMFIQAILFFMPRYLWRYCWENGRVRALTEKFNLVMIKEQDEKQECYSDVVHYLRRNKYDHFEYALKFILCEILNFCNVLVQLVLLTKTLGLGADVLWDEFLSSESNHNERSKIALVFPNIARCEIPNARPAGVGVVQEYCVLPVNVFVTKLYIFLWFYLYGLTIISGMALIYRGATFIPIVRTFLLKRRASAVVDSESSQLRRLDYGDWFILVQIGKNMDPFAFRSLIINYNDDIVCSKSRSSFLFPQTSARQRTSIISAVRESHKEIQID